MLKIELKRVNATYDLHTARPFPSNGKTELRITHHVKKLTPNLGLELNKILFDVYNEGRGYMSDIQYDDTLDKLKVSYTGSTHIYDMSELKDKIRLITPHKTNDALSWFPGHYESGQQVIDNVNVNILERED